MSRVVKGQDKGFMSAHSIAEVFAALTRLPVRPRIHAMEAVRIINDNILPHFEVVAVDQRDYADVLETMASGGWMGAKIYDAVLLACAAKCRAKRIYTFNLADFRDLAPEDLQGKICSP